MEDIRTGRINPEEELRNFLEKSLRLLRNEPKPEEPWQVELHVTLKKWGETMDEENKRWNRYRLLDDKFGHDAPTIEPIEENGMLDYMNRRWMAKQVKSNAALATGYHEYFKIEKKNDLDGEIKKQEDSCSVDESSKTSYKYGDSGNLESSNNDTIVKFYTNRSTNIAYRQINVYDVAASAAVAAGLT